MAKPDTIDQLEKRRNDLTKKIKAAKEKQRREASHLNDKRHAIIGKLLLKEADNKPDLKRTIDTLLKTKLTRNTERKLFDLPPMQSD